MLQISLQDSSQPQLPVETHWSRMWVYAMCLTKQATLQFASNIFKEHHEVWPCNLCCTTKCVQIVLTIDLKTTLALGNSRGHTKWISRPDWPTNWSHDRIAVLVCADAATVNTLKWSSRLTFNDLHKDKHTWGFCLLMRSITTVSPNVPAEMKLVLLCENLPSG